MITFIWSEEGETDVVWGGLCDLSDIQKLDFLQDTMGLATEKYNSELNKFFKIVSILNSETPMKRRNRYCYSYIVHQSLFSILF